MKSVNKTDRTELEKIAQLEVEIKKLKRKIAKQAVSKAEYKKLMESSKSFEERQKKSDHRFKTIFEESQLGNKILTSDLEIIEVNPAFVSMLGYSSKDDLINRKILEFAHPDFIQHWHSLQLKLWEEKILSFSLDTCLVRKDKSVFWCHVTSIIFEDKDTTLGYTIVEDINARKTLEEKAERLYQNQEMMMYMVAHDLKSPLSTIHTLSTLIKKNIEKNEYDKAIHNISLLDKTCVMNDSIIDDLILIGELESSKIEKEVVDIIETLQSVVDLVDPLAKKKNIQIVHEYSPTAVFAKVNKAKLSRVILNLLSNAIKFSNTGGQIKVAVKPGESSLLLQITDQGIGIPLDMQPAVFNKFTKAKRKGTEGETTTGLGLFISKRIVDIHNGKIWFESEPNQGTTFFIFLPLYD